MARLCPGCRGTGYLTDAVGKSADISKSKTDMLDAGVLARKRELHDQLVALAREERKTMVLGTSEAEAVSAVLKTAAGKKLYAEYDALQPGPA